MERRPPSLLCFFRQENRRNSRASLWLAHHIFLDRGTGETGGRRLGSRIIVFRQENSRDRRAMIQMGGYQN